MTERGPMALVCEMKVASALGKAAQVHPYPGFRFLAQVSVLRHAAEPTPRYSLFLSLISAPDFVFFFFSRVTNIDFTDFTAATFF